MYCCDFIIFNKSNQLTQKWGVGGTISSPPCQHCQFGRWKMASPCYVHLHVFDYWWDGHFLLWLLPPALLLLWPVYSCPCSLPQWQSGFFSSVWIPHSHHLLTLICVRNVFPQFLLCPVSAFSVSINFSAQWSTLKVIWYRASVSENKQAHYANVPLKTFLVFIWLAGVLVS